MATPAPGWHHNYAMINNIRMHYVEQAAVEPAAVEPVVGGAADKGAVVFCHGFPMLWFSWHRQIPVIALEAADELNAILLEYLARISAA